MALASLAGATSEMVVHEKFAAAAMGPDRRRNLHTLISTQMTKVHRGDRACYERDTALSQLAAADIDAAIDFVDTHWSAITAVAARLLQSPEAPLGSDEALKIATASPSARGPAVL